MLALAHGEADENAGLGFQRRCLLGAAQIVRDDAPQKVDGVLDPSLYRRQLVEGKATGGPVRAIVELPKRAAGHRRASLPYLSPIKQSIV